MDSSTGNHVLIRKVRDKRFSIDDLTHYRLSMLVGAHNFQFCVTDDRENVCLLVEDYALEHITSSDELLSTLYKLIENHDLLMAGYWKSVKLAVKNQLYTLVPDAFFDEQYLSDYLAVSTEPDARDGLYFYRHTQSEAVSVFAANKKFVERIRSIYPSLTVEVLHQGSVLIEGLQRNKDFTDTRDMYLHIDREHFSVMVLQNNRLQLYNRFPYAHSQHIIKYTMTTLQELGMNQNESRVLVWGNVPVKSEHYQALYRYIRNIAYGDKPAFLTFGYAFDEIPDHQYFDLFSLSVC